MGTKEDYEQFAKWNACERKKVYTTRKKAKKAARRLNMQFRNNKKVYRCRYCDQFHLGAWKLDKEGWKTWKSERAKDEAY